MNLLSGCTSNGTGDKGKDNHNMFMIGTDVQKVSPCEHLKAQGRGVTGVSVAQADLRFREEGEGLNRLQNPHR